MLKSKIHKDDIIYGDLGKIVLPSSDKTETFEIENDPRNPAFIKRKDRWLLNNRNSWNVNNHLLGVLKRVQVEEDGIYKKRIGPSGGTGNNKSNYFDELPIKRAHEPASVLYAQSVEKSRNEPKKEHYRRNGIFIHKSLNNLSVEKMSEASIDETINIREFTNVPPSSENKLILELQDEHKSILHTKEIKTKISNENISHSFKIQDLLNEKEINTANLAFLNAKIEIKHKDVDLIEEQCIKIDTNIELTGYWTNKSKTKITQANLSDKEDVYFYIKSKNIQDGTQAVLTIMEKDFTIDEKVTSLIFTINDNKAHIKIEFKKIKHTIIKMLDEEAIISKKMDELDVFGEISPTQLELYAKVKIDSLNIKKDLAKEKDDLLHYGVSWIKVGTRSLGNLPYPDSFPSEIAGAAAAIFLTINKIAKVLVSQSERALTYFDLEFIHQQFSFEDNSNIGFTKAYASNYNKDSKGDDYGQLQAEAQMSKPLIDTSTINEEELKNKSSKDLLQEDLDKYAWDKIYCDEETIKEAMYQVINEGRYSVTDEIYAINIEDLEREKLKTDKDDVVFTFTKINFLTPEEGVRYDLLSNNCQSFVKKVFDKYKNLEKMARKKEELGIVEHDPEPELATFSMGMG